MRRFLPLFVLAIALLLGGCLSYDPDRGVSVAPAASATRVGEVEDALLTEQAERQEGDKALRETLSETASALKAGIDPAPILAAARTDAEARDARQSAELQGKIEAARRGEIDWMEIIGISVGASGAGAYGVNRYRNAKAKREKVPAPKPV